MASRSSKRLGFWVAGCLAAGVALTSAQAPQERARADAAARRAAERIRALQQESDALARQESSILGELRKLEIQREITAVELNRIQADLAATEQRLEETAARAATLKQTADSERPDIEARLVQIYKLGRVGYWRLLLDVDDLRSLGRAYRNAAALTTITRDRAARHARTLDELARERKALEASAADTARLQKEATSARAALDRAVAARTALVESIDARRDLNAQLTGELEAAAQKLQASIAQLGNGRPANVALPIRPFKGALAWPASGFVVGRFGRQRSSRFGTAVTRNGIDISLAEGQPVRAVHEGNVAFASPFAGYGNLVIVDHGDAVYSLYGYLMSMVVAKGDRLEPGTRIGTSGRNPSGNPALYFELRVDGAPVDPLQWLKKQP